MTAALRVVDAPTALPASPAILDAALTLHAAGLCVLPAAGDGSKRPAVEWRRWQRERPDVDQLHAWFADGRPTGLGIVCGAVSGGLEVTELEGRAVDAGALTTLAELAELAGEGELWRRLTLDGWLVRSPSGGLHLLYRLADAEVPGNTKLAATAEHVTLAETRGAGGWVITAPSHGTVHPSGGAWLTLAGSVDTLSTITADERSRLHRLVRQLDERPAPAPAVASPFAALSRGSDGVSPGDDYAERTSWDDLLTPAGWRRAFSRGAVDYWRRPGKAHGISATTGYGDGDWLYVFTSSTEFDPERTYTRFGAYAVLHHSGDFRAAAKALQAAGYGSKPTDPALAALTEAPAAGSQHGTQPVEPAPGASWQRVDLADVVAGILSGQVTRPAPTIGTRDDGAGLFYAAKVNGVAGPSGVGKGWTVCHASVQQLAGGRHVVYVDFEDDAASVVGRHLDLGADPEAIAARLHYVRPDESYSDHAAALLAATIAAHDPALVIIDSTGESMALDGAKPNDDDDTARWFRRLPTAIARLGPAVVVVDHVVKADDGGLWPIGSQRKRAAISGAQYMQTTVRPFARDTPGAAKLVCAKDRHGNYRVGQKVAELTVTPTGDGVHVALAAPGENTGQAGAGTFRPTALMEKASRALEDATEPLSGRAIDERVRGKQEHVARAVEVLVAEGYVRREDGPRRSKLHTSVRPYRQSVDPASDAFIPAGDSRAPNECVTVSGPYDGGRETDTQPSPGDSRETVGTQSDDAPFCAACGTVLDDGTPCEHCAPMLAPVGDQLCRACRHPLDPALGEDVHPGCELAVPTFRSPATPLFAAS